MFKITREKIYRFLIGYIVVVFTTVLWFLLSGVFNPLMLGVMFLSPVLCFFFFPVFRKDEIPLWLLLLSIWGAALFHFSSFRLTTVVYASLFIITFLFYRRLLFSGAMGFNAFFKLVKILIFVYAFVLIIQQISVLVGLPVFNRCWIFGTSKFKLNSLAMEPSHIGRLLLLLQVAFISMREIVLGHKYSIKQNAKKDRWIWLAFLYVMLTCGSTTALISLVVLSCYFLGLKKCLLIFLFLSLGGASFFAFVNVDFLLEYEPIQRLYSLILVIFYFDTDLISETDLSASARISPILFYFDLIDPSSLSFWFGQGVDYSSKTLIVLLLNHESEQAVGGLFPSLFLDYGCVTGLLFLLCLRNMTMLRWASFPMFMWLFVFVANGFNTYVQWAFFIVMTTVLYFRKSNIIATERKIK